MRYIRLITALACGVAAGSSLAQVPALFSSGKAVFISPMGEPFRGPSARLMLRAWFDGADLNHDGSLTPTEMRSDAARVFGVLNRNGDSEIDPSELTLYETETAPEIRVGATVAGESLDALTYSGPDSTQSRAGAMAESIDNRATAPKRAMPRQGAGRFGLLATPNPVASADTNFNRGISADEFARAARLRFGLLDINHDGRLTIDELPPLPSR